jgi:hypothetical protein
MRCPRRPGLHYVDFNLAAPKTQQSPALADQPGLQRLQVINTLGSVVASTK